MTIPSEMNVLAITAPGGPEVLAVQRGPVPDTGDGSVLIRVGAAGVNYPDVLQRRGHYDPPPGASPLPGLEVAGEVATVGAGVDRWRIGDRVVALCNGGGYAEYVAVPAGQVLPLPDGWSLAQAAALPETFFTVEQTLVQRAGLRAGMTVLVHGAAGGIGGAAVQMARALGARPIAVVSDRARADYALELGAETAILHTETDFVAAARDITGNRGADRIVSIAGGDMLMRNLAALADGGAIVQLAGLSGNTAPLDIGLLLRRNATLIGSVLRPQPPARKAAIAAGLERDIWPALADGRIRPPRLAILPFAEAATAHRALEERSGFGKYVLVTAWGEGAG